MTQANYVTFSNNVDTRFLNPFEKGQSKGASFFGHRYGNAQFIFIVCATISLFLIQLLSDDFNKALIMILLILYYIYLYYNLSCFLVPDNHERCFTLAWTCITTVIFITIIVLFHNSIFKKKENKKSKKNIGGHKQTNLLANLNDNFNILINQIKGGDNCDKKEKHTGGDNCDKTDKYSGGENKNITLEEYLKSQAEMN